MNVPDRWCAFARQDLAAAEVLSKERLFAPACLHAQQSAEKSLKGILALLRPDDSLPRTHSISELVGRLEDLRGRLPEGIDTLDAFYIPTRYPDALPGSVPGGLPGEEDAVESIQLAREILALLESLMNQGDTR